MRKSKKHLSIKSRKTLTGYAFVSIWVIGFLVFTLYPVIYSFYLSMSDVSVSLNGIESTYVGFKHFVYAFRTDTFFPVNLINELVNIVYSVPLVIVFSIICALLLNTQIRGRTIFRAIFFFPVIIISGPVISTLIANKADETINPAKFAIYNFFLNLPPEIAFIGQPITYVFDNLVIILWFSGVQILIFLAGLQKIDRCIIEAAKIDGASGWEVFWKITLPYIKPLALVNTIYTIVLIAGFSTNAIVNYIPTVMTNIKMIYSYASAISWIYFICQLLLVLIAFLLLKEKSEKIR